LREESGQKAVTYFYEQGGHVPLARMDGVNAFAADGPPPVPGSESVYYYHCNIAGLPEDMTDSEGRLVWRGRYSTWGRLIYEQTTRDTPDNFSQPLRMQGQYDDGNTGLYYNTFRYYDADAGRFSAEDPISLKGGVNLYQYAPNPIIWADPLGLDLKLANTDAPVIGGLHQKVYVENSSTHYGVSFGMHDQNDPWQWGASGYSGSREPGLNVLGSGIVYEDYGMVTKIQKIFVTTLEEDYYIQQYMKEQVGKTGPYSPFTNSCRNYSENEFNKIKDMIYQRRKSNP
jgi:RHS repeat-associated protein